ncbi:MAG: nicotinamide riboside transporter PnuC [Armatimonadota bacterium]
MAWADLVNFVLAWRMPPVEVAGTVLSVAAVVLTIRRTVWCWPVWMAATAVYLWVFAEAKLYSDALLQVFFLAMQVVGWRRWGIEGTEAAVTALPARARIGWIVGTLAASAVWGLAMDRWTDAALPYPDAVVAIGSIATQWLQTRKRIESWVGWILVDIVATGVYAAKGLHPTTELYVGFTVLAVVGWRDWRREWRNASPGPQSAP